MIYRHHRNVAFCDDCSLVQPTTTYGMGAVRCDPCAQMFDAKIYADRIERARKEREALGAHIAEGCPDDGISCPRCCQHDEHDHGICLNCESDITDDLIGAAESAFEGDR